MSALLACMCIRPPSAAATTSTATIHSKFNQQQGFEINDQTGRPLTDKDMMEKHHSRVHVLQKVVFEHYRQALPDFPFVSSVAAGKVGCCFVLLFGSVVYFP